MPKAYQSVKEIKANPIGFDQATARKVIDAFNEHLAISYVLYFSVKKHHWLVRGPQWHDIHLLLDQVAGELLEQADFFAERITYFGGIPFSVMSDFERLSPIKHEGNDRFDLREMLAGDIASTVKSMKALREVHEMLDELNDYFDVSEIEVIIGKREKFCHELHFYIEPDELAAAPGDPHHEVLDEKPLAGSIPR